MANFKEIVTKAVIGKGKKTFTTNHVTIPSVSPSTILGCWVINHSFNGRKLGDVINVEGKYDVNIWYSALGDTKTEVANDTITYSHDVNVRRKSEIDGGTGEEIIVRSLNQPNCVKADIVDGKINYTIEKELGIEIVGDTKIKIAIDENEEPWDEIDTTDEEISQKIEEEVTEEFLED